MEQMKQQSKRPVVVGIGELLWDLLPTGKTAGGAPINFVYHASRLGAEGYAVSAIGDDEDGVDILKELDKNSIQYLIEKVPYPTGTVKVDLKEDGIPEIYDYRTCCLGSYVAYIGCRRFGRKS